MKPGNILRGARRYGICLVTVIFSLICSLQAIASEKFVLSATDGAHLFLRTYELDRNRIKAVDSNFIDPDENFGIFNTAVTFRNNNGIPIFDVFYGICQDDECINVALGVKRVDSNLDLKSGIENPSLSTGWWNYVDFATERVKESSGVSLRLLLAENGIIAERNLDSLNVPLRVAFRGEFLRYSAAEDGKMLVAWGENVIKVRPFNPAGPVSVVKIQANPLSLTLSGPITFASQSLSAGSIARKYRLLLYRVFGGDPQNPVSRIMMQKIDDSTGKLIGASKQFTDFKPNRYVCCTESYKSVTVTPEGNVVFFTEFDPACGREVLKAQVFNPQKGTKIGPPQLLIGCSEVGFGLSGIDVAQFQ